MDKLCFSIDEERYDDRHGHVLSLVVGICILKKRNASFSCLGMVMK